MKRFLLEPLIVLASVLVLLKVAQFFFPLSIVGFMTPLLLLYVPLFIFWRKGESVDFVEKNVSQSIQGLLAFAVLVLIIFPPYLIVAHYWMLKVFHYNGFHAAPVSLFFKNGIYQLLVVALPEEFFFRGYFQSQLKKFFKPRWNILGVSLGWGWIMTALIFAFAHSVIHVRWWHFSIFFPALLFGYLKERTGSITAPVLFHAFSNCFTVWYMHSYI